MAHHVPTTGEEDKPIGVCGGFLVDGSRRACKIKGWACSTDEVIWQMKDILSIVANIKGEKQTVACGQLRTRTQRSSA